MSFHKTFVYNYKFYLWLGSVHYCPFIISSMFFSKTAWPIKDKDETKIVLQHTVQITYMAAMLINGKKPSNDDQY